MQSLHIPDLDLIQASLSVLVHVDVDWEMCVDVSHLVLVTLGDTNDQVVDESADRSESGDVLSGTVVQFDVDDLLLWVREVDSEMLKVLHKLAYIHPVRILPSCLQPCFRCVPRGPSTVTIRDLMVTLTVVRSKLVNALLPNIPKRMLSPVFDLAVGDVSRGGI